MIYVALLRGINVGGNNKVAMSQLKQVFEAAGAEQVVTYINSGNVVFSDSRTSEALESLLEAAIAKEFGFTIRVLLRDQPNIAMLCRKIPAEWTNDDDQKTDVLFLWEEINQPTIIDKVIVNHKIEKVRYLDGALVWNIDRDNVTRGNSVKLIKSDLYKFMTIRNINTVRRLHSMMQALVPK